jgi:hypothetical protein
MGALCVLDAHLDPLRQAEVRVPKLAASHRQSRSEPIAGNALHFLKVAHPF